MMSKFLNLSLFTVTLFGIIGCGFHLRGENGTYQFPYKTVYLECDTPIICGGLKNAINKELLTTLVSKPESAEVTIVVNDEETNRMASNFNSVGQIAAYKLTYKVTARIYNSKGIQTMPDIYVMSQDTINYNNSLILSSSQQEEQTWDNIHQAAINTLIRKIVYSHPYLVSTNSNESK